MQNDTVGRKGLTEEEFLRQTRRDAVESYKAQLVEVLKKEIELVKGNKVLLRDRDEGIVRGIVNSKSLIQSHKIIIP